MKSGISPLNYCRQYRQQVQKTMGSVPDYELSEEGEKIRGFLNRTNQLCESAVKFILPDGGEMIEDHSFRALEGMDLRLPFPVIALEYREFDHGDSTTIVGRVVHDSSRRLLIAEEYNAGGNDRSAERLEAAGFVARGIRIWPISWIDDMKAWVAYNPLLLPRGFSSAQISYSKTRDVKLDGVHIQPLIDMPSFDSDYMNEVVALFSFLNALACKNVETSRAVESKPGKKGALGFDAYHVLSLARASSRGAGVGDQDHRSPREHLRRGHIRRLANGERVWVNACVVNAGIGGVIRKDYAV